MMPANPTYEVANNLICILYLDKLISSLSTAISGVPWMTILLNRVKSSLVMLLLKAIDASRAYWQLSLEEECAKLNTFITLLLKMMKVSEPHT